MSAIVADAMAQHQLDPLSATDVSLLRMERGGTHMHIGGIVVLEGPAPDFPTFREHVRERLRRVPRYRQRLVFPPAGLGRPRWVDDATFNLDYHLRHTGLPSPGGEAELWRQVGRVFSHRLDRTKPLWELWLVDGLSDGRWAIGAKTHHVLVDAVSTLDLLTVLFDRRADGDEAPRGADAWMPRPRPSGVELAVAGLRDTAGELARAASAAVSPRRLLGGARQAAEAAGERAWSLVSPAPPTPLNAPIGPHRAYTVVQAPLEDFRTVKRALGGTVNDVVLAVVAGGLARWLHARGLRTEGLAPRAGVPISVRAERPGALGTALTQVVVELPIAVHDPVERLAAVRAAMDGIKESRGAVDADEIAALADLAPPTLLAQASRTDPGSRAINLLVTNIPGPQRPLHLLGRRVSELYPIPFLAGDRALSVAAVSYAGTVGFGLLADPDAIDDLPVLAEGIASALADLLARARGQQPDGLGLRARPRRRPAKRDRPRRGKPRA